MAPRLQLTLTPVQQTELVHLRDHAPRAYIRERAAAILKVAAGAAVQTVAATGLLRAREPETVRAWITRYLTEGVPGLQVRVGRGRKPAFSPSPGQRGARRHHDPRHRAAIPPPVRTGA